MRSQENSWILASPRAARAARRAGSERSGRIAFASAQVKRHRDTAAVTPSIAKSSVPLRVHTTAVPAARPSIRMFGMPKWSSWCAGSATTAAR